LAEVIGGIVRDFDSKGKIDRTPLDLRPEGADEPDRLLSFPAKVLATEDGQLFIADSGHNRVLSVALDPNGTSGRIEAIIGGTWPGLVDGNFGQAMFRRPQGLALVGDLLYVADTENHAIRAIDLNKQTVTTVAGTGEQAHRFMPGGPALKVALNSPWDLAEHSGHLYVAMAGSHQLWRLDLRGGEMHLHAGTGTEAVVNGRLSGAALAQPSGLTTDGQRLYFADSESSAIRWADFDAGGRVGTIVGTGLFDFGDMDGIGNQVLLQHPQGLAWLEGKLYVADTYNNRVKAVDPSTRTSMAFLGTGEAGDRDGDAATFYEPGGISVARGVLYIADTNNHKIRVADVAGRRVHTLLLKGEAVAHRQSTGEPLRQPL
jgi:DNA-binding beta-propeller fold protein YncE